MTYQEADFQSVLDPLSYIPVEHTCGHFELRLTRWYKRADHERGYLIAGNKCNLCDTRRQAQAGAQPVYPTLVCAQTNIVVREVTA